MAETYSNSVVQGSNLFGTLLLGNSTRSDSIGVERINSEGAISSASDIRSDATSTSGNSVSDSLALSANGCAIPASGDEVIYFASPTKFYILTIP